MAYDEKKDVLLKDLGPVEGTELTAEIRKYNGGDPKIAFTKHFTKKNDEKGSRRAFSLPMAQAAAVGKFLMEVGVPQTEE